MTRLRELRVAELVFEAEAAGDEQQPLVLLLHGFPQTSHTWRAQLPALADAGFFALAPNQRGYSSGARPKGVEHYSTEKLLADALAMADAFGAARFHLVGHDWGGQLSWLIAAHHPERVKTLTVLSRPHPAAFARAMNSDAEQPSRSSHHRAFQKEDAADRLLEDGAARLRATLAGQGVPPDAVKAYLSRLSERAALDAAIHWYRAAPHSDPALLGPNVPIVSAPTLYLWGDRDATVGRMAAEATREFVHGPYELKVIPGAGHFLTDEKPDQINDALLRHLAG